MRQRGAAGRIKAAVSAWPGVGLAPHRFGGLAFTLGSREIGHLHGDSLLHVPFPKRIRNELIEKGLARPHHILPDSGWISLPIDKPGDVDAAIALLRRSFDVINEQLARRRVQARAAKAQID
jgi:hypothetical protein